MKSNDLHQEVLSISSWNRCSHLSVCFCVSHFVFLLQQKREDLLVTTLKRSRWRNRLKVCLLGLAGSDPNSVKLLSEV